MKYFITERSIFLVPSKECCEEFDKLDEFMEILNLSRIDEIIKINKNTKGRNGYNTYNLVATIIFCFSQFRSSLREIEKLCVFDLRVIYLMRQQQPSYKAIENCINKYILPHGYEIFTRITKTIIDKFGLDTSNQYLDGSKFEANANKYKFVWKPIKYHNSLDLKIKELLNKMNINFRSKELITSFELNEIIKKYVLNENIDITSIPTGKGKRLTEAQRNYKLLHQYLIKLLDYEEKEKICGDRNSYYKTDHDATAMMLKKDYYSKYSNDFHAGYNGQVLVGAGLITLFGVFQNRNDYHTFIPMNDLYYKYYGKYPLNECADAGYGIYCNYLYSKENGINPYIKFQSWEGESSGKNPQLFFFFDDGVMCLNACIGEQISFNECYHQRKKGGRLYKFTGCNSCNYSYKCKKHLKNKDNDFRIVELIPEYELLKENVRKILLSPKGIEIRVNRSIQVEGTFGQIKNNMQYVRIRRRGLESVSCEFMLMCLGRNIRKFLKLLDADEIKSNYWDKPENLKNEKFPFVKQRNYKKRE